MTEAQRHQILLDMLAQLGFVTVENVVERLGISQESPQRRRSHYPAASTLDANEFTPGAEPR